MTREWKPGDVALWVPASGGAPEVVFQCTFGPDYDTPIWMTAEDGEGYVGPGEARPLVVIDPEDETLPIAHALYERLESLGTTDFRVWRHHIRDALREFADPKPPKPEEPTGLGAVVEDDKGRLWTRADRVDPCWCNAESEGNDWAFYSDITAVRILGEGVTA